MKRRRSSLTSRSVWHWSQKGFTWGVTIGSWRRSSAGGEKGKDRMEEKEGEELGKEKEKLEKEEDPENEVVEELEKEEEEAGYVEDDGADDESDEADEVGPYVARLTVYLWRGGGGGSGGEEKEKRM